MHYRLCVTIDVDPDGATFAGDGGWEWRSLDGLPGLRAILDDAGCPATWFLRTDDGVARAAGSYAFVYERWRGFWDEARAAGHELAVHPHFCGPASGGTGYVRLRDPALCCGQLRRVHGALRAAGLEWPCIRVGEAFHCKELMALIDELGYLVDSTAMPGRVRHDAERQFDWQGTPNAPYHPSRADHRLPGTPCFGVLEVPMTTMRFRADFDPAPMLRYASLTYRPDIFAAGLRAHLAERPATDGGHLVFIIHPAELDGRMADATRRQLYAFDVDAVRRNLRAVVEAVGDRGATHAFCTLGALARRPEAAPA